MIKRLVGNFIKENVDIVSNLFINVITSTEVLSEYESQNIDKILAKIRFGHLLASFLFVSFGFYDIFIIEDKSILYNISIIRLVVFIFVLTPFFILTFKNKLDKFFHFSLFTTYLIFGGFIVYISSKFNVNEVAFFHNYLALNLTILGLFVIHTIKVRYSIILAAIFIIGYNLICYFNAESGIFFSKTQFHLSNFIDINIWLLSISFLGYVIWRYNDNLAKQNFLVQKVLIEQKAELKKANDIRNKFFSIVTHDIKNLVAAQYSISNFLAEKYKDLPEHKIQEFVKLIEGSALKTLDVFEELMIWMHAQTNRIEIDKRQLNIHVLVSDTIGLLEPNLIGKNISVINNVHAESSIFCDENSLKTILRNLLGNAIKFSNKNSQIIISSDSNSTKTIIKVQDFGVGMVAEKVNTLFKVDETNSQKGTEGEEGTGLGLIICDEILKLNSGEIWVESACSKGTTVLFGLPKSKV